MFVFSERDRLHICRLIIIILLPCALLHRVAYVMLYVGNLTFSLSCHCACSPGFLLHPAGIVDATTGSQLRSDLHTLLLWESWRESQAENVSHHCVTTIASGDAEHDARWTTHTGTYWTVDAALPTTGGWTATTTLRLHVASISPVSGLQPIKWSLRSMS